MDTKNILFECLHRDDVYQNLCTHLQDNDFSACLSLPCVKEFSNMSVFADQFDYWTNCGALLANAVTVPLTSRTAPSNARNTSGDSKKVKKRVVPTTILHPAPDIKNSEAWPSLSEVASKPNPLQTQRSAWPTLNTSISSSTPACKETNLDSVATLASLRSSSPPAPSAPSPLDTAQSRVAQRMGHVYGLLVKHHALSYDRGIRKVCKLLSGRSVPPNSHDILVNETAIHIFAEAALHHLLLIIQCIGGPLLSSLYHVLKITHPVMSQQLQDVFEVRGERITQHTPVPTFMRIFDEDKDSRYEYKTQVETAAYNERERCFDDISNLIRQYQKCTLEIDKSAEEEFYFVTLPATTDKLLTLMDVNYMWFAEVFRDLLLFNCCNATASQRMEASNRQRNLEARLGAPKPQRRAPASSSFGKYKSLFISMESISTLFKGDEQFFYRFILVADSHRFNSLLVDVIISEISTISFDDIGGSLEQSQAWSGNNAMVEAINTEEFTLRVMKLCLLGRFLGLLCFYPHWSLSASLASSGPLVTTSRRNAHRHLISSDLLLSIMQKASREERLSLSMPWVGNFLQMASWDVASVDVYRECITYLQSLCTELATHCNNRLYIVLSAEHVLSRFPSYLPTTTAALVTKDSEDRVTLDRQNLCFSKRFLDHVTPLLGEALQFCQRRLQSEKIRSPSIDLPQTPRRQTPQFLSPSKPLYHNNVSTNALSGLSIGIADTMWSPKDSTTTPRMLRSMSKIDDKYDKSSFLQRLQASFWNQHPHLQQISSFVVDRLFIAAKQHLREHIAHSVYQAWSICDQGTEKDNITAYTARIQKELGKLHQSSHKNAKLYLEGFVKDHLQATLSRLYAMYPINIRIRNMALHLTLQQKDKFVEALLEYFSSYSKKKLQEVCNASVSQLVKLADKSPVSDTPTACWYQTAYYGTIVNDVLASVQQFVKCGITIVNCTGKVCDSNLVFSESCSCKLDNMTIDMNCLYYLNESIVQVSNDLAKLLSVFLALRASGSLSSDICPFNVSSQNNIWGFYRDILRTYISAACRHREACSDSESRGRISVEVLKLFTSIVPLLVDVDAAYVTKDIHLLQLPYELLSVGFIDIEALCRTLTVASKTTAAMWPEKTKTIRNRTILQSIGEYLASMKPADIDVDDSAWATDPAVRRVIKQQITPSLSLLVEVLANSE